ncbi:hypothetical protein ACIQUS_09010 [Pseudomonas sp. NPDC090755]|uniref:hypothetical protein n=1 Tax=Pseudomonas sp. NPDC090755 TaxID=3364481 RepID=UPI00383B1433
MRCAGWLGIAALCLAGLAAAHEADDWQASVELQMIGEPAAQLPQVVVPKQSVLLTVTVWMPRAINWYPRYPQWDMPGATLLPLMMLSPGIERERGTFTQRGATQNYLLTPLAQGHLRLTPASINVYPDQADSPALPIAPVELQVALPAGAGSLERFLPATALKLTQAFYLQTGAGSPQALPVEALDKLQLQRGQLLERRITLEAKGIQGNQIPPLPVDDDAVQHQAQTADLNNYGDFSGGTRIEHWFYASGTRETLVLNPLVVRWYDTGAQRFRTARLDGGEVRAQTTPVEDSRLRLGWQERLALLSSWQIGAALACLVLLGLTLRYFGTFRLAVGRELEACRRRVRGAEPYLFLKACCWIGIAGLRARQSCGAFDRWVLRTGATGELEACQAIQHWYRGRFAADAGPGPSRLVVIAELLSLRYRRHRQGRMAIADRFDLPALHCGVRQKNRSSPDQ